MSEILDDDFSKEEKPHQPIKWLDYFSNHYSIDTNIGRFFIYLLYYFIFMTPVFCYTGPSYSDSNDTIIFLLILFAYFCATIYWTIDENKLSSYYKTNRFGVVLLCIPLFYLFLSCTPYLIAFLHLENVGDILHWSWSQFRFTSNPKHSDLERFVECLEWSFYFAVFSFICNELVFIFMLYKKFRL